MAQPGNTGAPLLAASRPGRLRFGGYVVLIGLVWTVLLLCVCSFV